MARPGIDSRYMARALELARHGLLFAHPNPMVGAVIVGPDGRIIGEGYHRRCGSLHAEPNAINSVADKALLREATMYVTLEPCSHYGKTPPCALKIIETGIPRVVVGCLDPFEKVSGRGVRMLREAGVDVTVGVLEEECKALNHKFIFAHTNRRPYVTLKWAQSRDGYLGAAPGNPRAIFSTPESSVFVHKLRAMNDAILIGAGTAVADRPRLDTRLFDGPSPRRVLLDSSGRASDYQADIRPGNPRDIATTLTELYEAGVTTLLVEGGAEVLRSFLASGLWNEARVEIAPVEIADPGAVKAPSIPLNVVKNYKIQNNTILEIVNQ